MLNLIPGITFSGVSDEAGPNIYDQINAHRMLGWQEIELRSVNNIPISNLTNEQFQTIGLQVKAANLSVKIIDSYIGNWKCPITSSFQQEVDELLTLIDRIHFLGGRYIRIMSYPNNGLKDSEWESKVFERLAKLVEIAEKEKVILVHENCSGWASENVHNTLKMICEINSPALRLLFDTGNPIYYGYDGLEFLRSILPWVVHVHVKDGIKLANGEVFFTYPGQGESRLLECLSLLIKNLYHGSLSIEPHLKYIPHLGVRGETQSMWETYVSYGKLFQELVLTHFLRSHD